LPDDRFRSLFFEEAREQLQALEAGLMDLEARREDRAHLDRTFRAAHTIKGAAGMVGLAALARFTHAIEAVLDRIRSGSLVPVPEVITILLAAKDHLAAAVEAEGHGQTLDPPGNLVGRLEALASGQAPGAPTASGVEPACYRIRLAPGRDTFRKGINPLGMLDELRELGEAWIRLDIDLVPPLKDLDPQVCDLAWTVDLRTGVVRERLDEVFLFLEGQGQVAIEPLDESRFRQVEYAPPPTPPYQGGEQSLAPPRDKGGVGGVRSAIPSSAPVLDKVGLRGMRPPRPPSSARIRVEAAQLDELVGMAGELAILAETLQGLAALPAAGRWAGSLEALDRLGRRLREATLELRMVPIEELFARFPRLVRDLAEATGKQVELRLEGEETRLDRTIIERLAEPMIHLVRNAIDHGLEAPEERVAAGKPPAGHLTIAASYEGDRVAIRVADDGRGLDRARIARKGMALGLLPPGTAVSEPRVAGLVFEAGFSTRDQAGAISGRGVGLDVVRDAIRALQGSIRLRSDEGRGTTFLIRLPLTLAMIEGLLVEAAGQRFVVPLGQVEECLAAPGADLVTGLGRGAAVIHGEWVPIVSLHDALGTPAAKRPDPRGQEILLTRDADQRVAVAVDRLLGRIQAVIQAPGEALTRLQYYSGATILGDGAVCLILDLPGLVASVRAVPAPEPTSTLLETAP
jgi:two-component system chemotaxis sensor kinase CheA